MGRHKKLDISEAALEELRAIGARLKAARAAAGFSQTAAAARTVGSPWGELTQAAWSRLEVADVLPTVFQLRAAAAAVGLPPAAIAFGLPEGGISEAAMLIDRFLAAGDVSAAMMVLASQIPKPPRQ